MLVAGDEVEGADDLVDALQIGASQVALLEIAPRQQELTRQLERARAPLGIEAAEVVPPPVAHGRRGRDSSARSA
jgi:hypothetical protein